MPTRSTLIIFERQSTEQDAAGQPLNVWREVGRGWAFVRSFTGAEYVSGSGEKARIGREIVTAFQSRLSITPADRIRIGPINNARYLGIESVQNKDEGNRDLFILCTEWSSTVGSY